jgi:hypothetical protein
MLVDPGGTDTMAPVSADALEKMALPSLGHEPFFTVMGFMLKSSDLSPRNTVRTSEVRFTKGHASAALRSTYRKTEPDTCSPSATVPFFVNLPGVVGAGTIMSKVLWASVSVMVSGRSWGVGTSFTTPGEFT